MKLLRILIAIFRLNKRIVCEESADRSLVDFHDYPDTAHKTPLHFTTHTCERCRKKFVI
jgi:hypothetical protein